MAQTALDPQYRTPRVAEDTSLITGSEAIAVG